MKWLDESELALKAASSSADMIEETQTEGIAITTKGSPRDIVTELDLAIEELIRNILKTSRYKIIGEETIKNEKISPSKNEPVWFIDPIDGTTNFISAIPYYSTSIGLVEDFKFHVGAVAMPALKEIFFTIGDQGSYRNGKLLKVHPSDLNNSLVAAGFSGNPGEGDKRQKEYELFGKVNDSSRGCLRLGSASVNICNVAAGRLGAAYAVSNKIWDIAGAIAVALQSGCKVYIERIDGTDVNYVVGAPGAADEIAEMINRKNLANLLPISKGLA
jgi:myo-inositol-1(or 4)-monophosphatase